MIIDSKGKTEMEVSLCIAGKATRTSDENLRTMINAPE
jgi:hypothetical protein